MTCTHNPRSKRNGMESRIRELLFPVIFLAALYVPAAAVGQTPANP